MNRWKKGQRLQEEISLARNNAHYAYERNDIKRETECLNLLIDKAKKRLIQIEKQKEVKSDG